MNTNNSTALAMLIPILGLAGCAAPPAPQGAVVAHVIANFES